MAFLTINGAAVPVAKLDESFDVTGERSRAFDGTQRKSFRNVKRSWKIETTIMPVADAEILERTLRGLGDAFTFDDHLFSSKGLKPSTYANAVYKRGKAADGLPVLGQGKFNSSGVCNTVAVSNLLTANQSNIETDTTGFTAVDSATISRDTSFFYEGVASLKVITSAAANGVRGGVLTNNALSGSGSAIVGSAYVMAATAVAVRIYVRNESTATDGTPVSYTLTPYTWQRLEAIAPAHGAADNLRIFIVEETADSAITFYVDNIQLEVNAGSFARPWIVGGSTSTASGAPIYTSFSVLGTADEITISCWIGKMNETSAAAYDLAAGSSDLVIVQRASATTANVLVRKTDGSQATVTTVTGLWTSDIQNMITVVLRQTRTPSYEVYKDGALFASGTLSPGALFSTNDTLSVACDDTGTLDCDGAIDDLILLPFAVDAATVAGWYALGKSIAIYPRLWLSGDAVPAGPVMVQVKPDTSKFTPVMSGSSFDNAARAVSFVLEEV